VDELRVRAVSVFAEIGNRLSREFIANEPGVHASDNPDPRAGF
jgi:hypothetical protein